jgi:hypothetical protein
MDNTLIVYPLARELPTDLFESQELLEGDDGELFLELVLSVRTLSVWWPVVVKMKTPEYPGVVRLS